MKFVILFFLAAIAIGSALDCSEERAQACIQSLLEAFFSDTIEEEVCRELKSAVDCLQNIVDECLGDEADKELEDGLKDLEQMFRDKCEEGNGGDKDMEKCFKENEDYVYECIYEGSSAALDFAFGAGLTDENILQCVMYGMIAECFVERVGERCGQEAAKLAEQEFADLPEEIQQVCDAAGNLEGFDIELLDKKRK